MGKTVEIKKSRKIRFNASSSLGVTQSLKNIKLLETNALEQDQHKGDNRGNEEQVPVVIKKIQSQEVNERVWACASIGQLLGEDSEISVRKRLLANGVIEKVIDRLLDSSKDVCLEASGVLRNLAANGSSEYGKEIYTEQLLNNIKLVFEGQRAHIGEILQQNGAKDRASDVLQSENKEKLNASEQRVIFGIVENIFVLINTMCEGYGDKALYYVNDLGVIELAAEILVHSQYLALGRGLVYFAAQLMYTITENNEKMANMIFESQEMAGANGGVVRALMHSLDLVEGDGHSLNQSSVVKVLTGASIINMIKSCKQFSKTSLFSETKGEIEFQVKKKIMQLIGEYLNVDKLYKDMNEVVDTYQQEQKRQQQRQTQKDGGKEENEGGEEQEQLANGVNTGLSIIKDKMECVNREISNYQICLEIASNIFMDGEVGDFEAVDDIDKEDDANVDSMDQEGEQGEEGEEGEEEIDEDENYEQNGKDENGNDQGDDDMWVDNDEFEDMETIMRTEGVSDGTTEDQGDVVGLIEQFVGVVIPQILKLLEYYPNRTTGLAGFSENLILHESLLILNTTASICLNNFLSLLDASATGSNNSGIIKLLSQGGVNFYSTCIAWFKVLIDTISNVVLALKDKQQKSYPCATEMDIVDNKSSLDSAILFDLELQAELIERLLSCVWTLARIDIKCVEVSAVIIGGFIDLYNNIENLLSAYTAKGDNAALKKQQVDIKVCIVGILGRFARIQDVQLNSAISQFLLYNVTKPIMFSGSTVPSADFEPDYNIIKRKKALTSEGTKQSEKIIVVQVIDDIFDIYADAAFVYDGPVFVSNNYLSFLESLVVPLKKFAKTIDKRKSRSFRAQTDLLVVNLMNFIKYKKSELK
ncbi:putative ARM-like repeat-containing protein [Zancudomyces culisetae]|uniref:Putative ARM-like repeat-containing protein n=1 Tax=Zancudomyces culisetae TaxID=1213189 RepID=A0A1R1PBL9_ZANCU|nr:putative ARM-like repeat-containing protein [Zancudomyces culisetae]|eukprot:OMH78367.1 putative ARM-like repeat-containing protein [Zancudomyces culisetae]